MLAELPPELLLHIISFLTRLPGDYHLAESILQRQELIPDLPSINALSQTNTVLYHTLNETLYELCASVVPLGAVALFFAVEYDLESTLDKCVAAGISLDTEYIFGRPRSPCSLLHIAAAMGSRAMVSKLLDMYGEGMQARAHARCPSGTALDFATRNGHMDVVRLLAPIPMPSSDVCPNVSPSVSIRFETQEHYLGRALMDAIDIGDPKISEYLVSLGADVDFSQRFGTPLYFAVSSKNLRLVQFLLASGADPNRSGSGGLVPLFNAASVASIEITEALLAGGANLHAEDLSGSNVLQFAQATNMLQFFLERGVNPNHRNQFGRTPLHYACRRPDTAHARIELLLQFGAMTAGDTDDYGYTPVALAMADDAPQLVRMLEPLVHDPALKMKIATWWDKRDSEVRIQQLGRNS